MPFVFDFEHTHGRPPMELKDVLGGKGANLAEIRRYSNYRCRPGSPSRLTPAVPTCPAAGPRTSMPKWSAPAPA
jgi:hypothetical protein